MPAQTKNRQTEDAPADPQTDGQTPQTDGEATPEGATAPATTATTRRIPDTSTVSLDAINGAALASQELIAASAPVRERSDQQKAMDAVAVRAYAAWVEAGRPTAWPKVPVITYFLDSDDLPKYRYLIRRACEIVEPTGDSSGVRVKFGNEFTLREDMAEKLGKPELAGKTVLAWAAVDKRPRESEAPATVTN